MMFMISSISNFFLSQIFNGILQNLEVTEGLKKFADQVISDKSHINLRKNVMCITFILRYGKGRIKHTA